jgi:uncharacterized protein YgiM (DUF1202 family)
MTEYMAKVTKSHQQSYADPITMRAGDTVEISGKEDNWNGWVWIWCTNQQGKSGWVPKSYVELSGSTGRARCDYDAIELSVSVGEEVLIEKEESGWVWCINRDGKRGWVPVENIEIAASSS